MTDEGELLWHSDLERVAAARVRTEVPGDRAISPGALHNADAVRRLAERGVS